jgi:predicted  nucleic acid-binding Zn-ribbon protein
MEFITNIVNAKPSVGIRSTASKLAADKAAKEGAILRQKLSREIVLKNAALQEKSALSALLDNVRDNLSEAYQKISELESKIFDLEAELKEAKSKKNKKEKKQEQETSPSEQEFTVIS